MVGSSSSRIQEFLKGFSSQSLVVTSKISSKSPYIPGPRKAPSRSVMCKHESF